MPSVVPPAGQVYRQAVKVALVILAGVVRRLSENTALSPADSLGAAGLDGLSDVDRKQRELYTRQQQLLREQRTADQEKLLATISGMPCLLNFLSPASLSCLPFQHAGGRQQINVGVLKSCFLSHLLACYKNHVHVMHSQQA